MFPTSTTLPLSPFLNLASMGTLVVLVGLGAVVSLVAGYAFGRHVDPAEPAIEVLSGDAVARPERRRVNG